VAATLTFTIRHRSVPRLTGVVDAALHDRLAGPQHDLATVVSIVASPAAGR
jgi:hypothetical protein